MERRTEINVYTIRDWLRQENDVEPTEVDIAQAEQALQLISEANAIHPPPQMRTLILDKIKRLNQQILSSSPINVKNPPLIEPDSNWLDWQAATAHILPPPDLDTIYMHPLRSDDIADMFVVFVQDFVPEEVHHDVLESFLLLEGACVCTITDLKGETRQEYYGEGDYISFKYGEVHDVQIISTVHPAKAILQWLKKAA